MKKRAREKEMEDQPSRPCFAQLEKREKRGISNFDSIPILRPKENDFRGISSFVCVCVCVCTIFVPLERARGEIRKRRQQVSSCMDIIVNVCACA